MCSFTADALILKTLSHYVSTYDFLNLAKTSQSFYEDLCNPSILYENKKCFISTEEPLRLYIHAAFDSIAKISDFISKIRSSGLRIPGISMERDRIGLIFNIFQNVTNLSRFCSEYAYLCSFQFDPDTSTDFDPMTSNIVSVGDGEISLFKRRIPASLRNANEGSSSQSALGIKLESSTIWIVHVVALTGDRRVDLKAGSTKQDPLRIPTGQRGTWSDLFPVDKNYAENGPIFFLVEVI
jgi:hypothetical protein